MPSLIQRLPFERRLAMYARPLPFVGGTLFLLLGVSLGLNWDWSTSIFLGSVMVQTLVPSDLIAFKPLKILFMVLGVVGLGLFAIAFGGRRAVENGGRFAPKWRFYPMTTFLGLFLLIYGAVFMFNVSFAADDVEGGFVFFTSFNYSGILSRLLMALFGVVVLFAGLWVLSGGAVEFDTGLMAERVRPAVERSSSVPPRSDRGPLVLADPDEDDELDDVEEDEPTEATTDPVDDEAYDEDAWVVRHTLPDEPARDAAPAVVTKRPKRAKKKSPSKSTGETATTPKPKKAKASADSNATPAKNTTPDAGTPKPSTRTSLKKAPAKKKAAPKKAPAKKKAAPKKAPAKKKAAPKKAPAKKKGAPTKAAANKKTAASSTVGRKEGS